MRANTKPNKQNLVTVIGANYIDLIIPDFLEKCFDVYKKTDFDKKQFQVSIYENAFATAGIVLTVLGFEAYRNRVYYLEKKRVGKSVAKDLALIFKSKESTFPDQNFENLLSEIFVVRDVIVHNHIYEVNVEFDDDWQMLGHRQKLLAGYGDEKFRNLANSRTKKTSNLKLNVQPGKIGFEDLFLILIIFDCFIGFSEKILNRPHVPFHFWKQINGESAEQFYQYLTYFYNQIPNDRYIRQLNLILKRIETDYTGFLPDYRDYFINNTCAKCEGFGFRQMNDVYACKKCGHKLEFNILQN